MAAKKKSKLSAVWPFAPASVGLNTDTDLLKIVAMVTMLVDHMGKMFFPQYNIMRIIGRIAFPIYAYCIAVGCVYTRDHLKYLTRLVLIALISQPFYAVALGHTSAAMYSVPFAENPVGSVVQFYLYSWAKPSILVSLILGLIIIWTIRERRLVLTLAMVVVVWKFRGAIDYGWRGIVLMVLFYLFCKHWWLSLPAVFAFMAWWGTRTGTYELFGIRFGIQMFAVIALPLIYIPTYSGIKLNKWVFYLFYPAHLILIMALAKVLG